MSRLSVKSVPDLLDKNDLIEKENSLCYNPFITALWIN